MAYEKHTARAPEPSDERSPVEYADHTVEPSTDAEPVVRTPQPKVLARIPQADPPRCQASSTQPRANDRRSTRREANGDVGEPSMGGPQSTDAAEAPKGDRLPGFDGRMINQRLATRILIGGAVALLLVAIVPMAFRGDPQDQDPETANSEGETSSWTPENPAPDATAAPAWEPSAQTPTGPPTASVPPDWPGAPQDYGDPAESDTPSWAAAEYAQPSADRQFSQDGLDHPQNNPYPDQGGYQDARSSSNRSQSLPAEDVPGGPVARQADHRASMPDAHAPAGGYDGQYEAAQPYPAYRQAYRHERPALDSSTPTPRYGDQPSPTHGEPTSHGDWRSESSDGPSSSNYGSSYDSGYDTGEYTPIQPPPTPEPDRRGAYQGTRRHRAESYPDRDYADDRYRNYHRPTAPSSPSYTEPAAYQGTASYRDGGSGYSRQADRYAPSSPGQDAPYRGSRGYGGQGETYEPAGYEASPSAANAVTPAARFRGDIERPAVNAAYDNPQRGLY